jgi:pimeloyl-ACP methyl ester carboxylesterase
MRAGEAKALGKLAGDATAGPLVLAREMDAAISGRTFGALGLLGAPVRVIYQGISKVVYRSVGAALRGPVAAAASLLPSDGRSLADGPAGGMALAALNGVAGDALDEELALDMSVRHGGVAVELEPEEIARAFADATPKLAVFVHGLCETEHAWRGLGRARRLPSYGALLRDELGYTPVYVRYHTGLHVSDNGRELASTIERLVDGWPCEVEQITLIGHSMGGLVARSACHYGGSWTESLRHVFCLGTPHLGAPLEKAANAGAWALGRLSETRPFANVVNLRSVGIKDLRYGSCIEEDWLGHDPDELLRCRCGEVPFVQGATYYFVAATLRPPLGTLVGDLLVMRGSASGRGRTRRIPFEIDNGRHVDGLNHFQLLNHPSVYEQIRAWLSPARRIAQNGD